MIRIGRLLLGKRPAIAVSLTDQEDLSQLRAASRYPVPLLLELRIDRFRSLDPGYVLKKIRAYRKFRLPLIATIRSAKEGGKFIPDSKRAELFQKILPEVQAVDLELSSTQLRKKIVRLARRKGIRIIISYHNFERVPPESFLGVFIKKAQRAGADIVKLAVTPKTAGETGRLLLFSHRHRKQNLIAIGMGKQGEASRILVPLFGSLFSYAYLGRAQAPGQLALSRLQKEMKVLEPAPL